MLPKTALGKSLIGVLRPNGRLLAGSVVILKGRTGGAIPSRLWTKPLTNLSPKVSLALYKRLPVSVWPVKDSYINLLAMDGVPKGDTNSPIPNTIPWDKEFIKPSSFTLPSSTSAISLDIGLDK